MFRLLPLGKFLRPGTRCLITTLTATTLILIVYISIEHSRDESRIVAEALPIDTSPSVTSKLESSSQAPKRKSGKVVTQSDLLIYKPAIDTKVLRALLLFYPSDQENEFAHELRWFFRSWIEMMTVEPPLWRTDMIIYASEYSTLFKELGCVFDQVRPNASEPVLCRVFPYVRIKDRTSKHEASSRYQVINRTHSEGLHRYLRGYGYIDSINTVLEYKNSYSMYDYILRTDMDCFLTQNFARYVPYNNTLIVGRGGYSTDFNQKRLQRIARDMGWSYAGQRGLGSTW
jgi:hypothetical protein